MSDFTKKNKVSKMKMINVIVAAAASSFGIGKNGDIPWYLKGDLAHFRNITSKTSDENKRNAVIMGRKTWNSIPPKFRPFKNRINVILSRNTNLREELSIPDEVLIASSIDEAVTLLSSTEMVSKVDKIYVIGGEAAYKEAVASPLCDRVHLTIVNKVVDDADTFFPRLDATRFRMLSRSKMQSEKDKDDENNDIKYYFTEFESIKEMFDTACSSSSTTDVSQTLQELKGEPIVTCSANEEESQYLRLCDDIIKNGARRGDRTGTGTLSKFGVQMRFSLRNEQFPLLTTKKVFWRGVAEELLWFVKGSTNAKELSDKKIHIWDGNGSKEFLESRGLGHREEGDLGPVYGFQWRHFGADYETMHSDYEGKGVDQLMQCINKIKNSPEDRRIILTAWNPSDLDKMALPPCHMFAQFYVANGELSCQMYQRSADMGLGVPFNIASYSLLTRMIADCCDLKAGDFVHTIGDAHVYMNHVDALKEQISRTPREFPKLILKSSNGKKKCIDEYQMEDFEIVDYNPMATIKMKMAV